MVQVWICSPIPAMRAGLSALIAGDLDLAVEGTAGCAADIPAAGDLPPCVVIATPGGVDLSAFDLPAQAALLLVGSELAEFTHGADSLASLAVLAEDLEGRAWGFISPESTPEALQAAVRALSEGLAVLSPDVLREMLRNAQAPDLQPAAGMLAPGQGVVEADRLTEREVEVLRLLSQGLTNKQAARTLGISEHTVKFHVSSIYAKLGVTNRAEAVRKGARGGWIAL